MQELSCEIVSAVAGAVARHRGFDLEGTRLICTAEQAISGKGDDAKRWILAVLPGAAPVQPGRGDTSPGSPAAKRLTPRTPVAAVSATHSFRFPGQRGLYGAIPGRATAAAAEAPAAVAPAPSPAPKTMLKALGRYLAVDWRTRHVHVAIDGRDKYCHWMSHLGEPDLVRLDDHAESYDVRALDNRIQLRLGEEWYLFG